MSEKTNEQVVNTPSSSSSISSEFLIVKVINQNGDEVQFRLKKKTPLKKMMTSYCEKNGIDLNTIRFLYDGKRIDETDTAESLAMENEDNIDAVLSQTGGAM